MNLKDCQPVPSTHPFDPGTEMPNEGRLDPSFLDELSPFIQNIDAVNSMPRTTEP